MIQQKFEVGDRVLYSPQHVAFKFDTQNVFGVVSSVAGEFPQQRVWVRFKGPTGELTPTKCLLKEKTVFYHVPSTSIQDGHGRQEFWLMWPSDNLGERGDLCGLRTQIFNAVLDRRIEINRKRGFEVFEFSQLTTK